MLILGFFFLSILIKAEECVKFITAEPPRYTNYTQAIYSLNITRSHEHYKIARHINQGTFGETYKALDTRINQYRAIKIFKTKGIPTRILHEIYMAQVVCGFPNIVKLVDILETTEKGKPAVVYEFVNIEPYQRLFHHLSPKDVQFYARELLKTLVYIHEKEIIHCDVKPSNIGIDPRKREIKLLDWGIAKFYEKGVPNEIGGLAMYKAPELLFGLEFYDFGVDIWGFGCIFYQMVFRTTKNIFRFSGAGNELKEIARVLGSQPLIDYGRKKGFPVSRYDTKIEHMYKKQSFRDRVDNHTALYATDTAIDLLHRLLTVDHELRITAKQALEHPYFQTLV